MTKTKEILEALEWRYATKVYETTQKVSNEDLDTLLESIRLAPTSFGLQAYKVLVITDPEVKAKLKAVGYQQPQITDSSHLLVFAAKTKISDEEIDAYIANTAAARNSTIEQISGFGKYLKGTVNKLNSEQQTIWNSKQTYIALGMLLQTAAQLHIDASPLEGFDALGFDQALGLTEQNFTTSVICAIGYRHEEDANQHLAKVRKSHVELFEFI